MKRALDLLAAVFADPAGGAPRSTSCAPAGTSSPRRSAPR